MSYEEALGTLPSTRERVVETFNRHGGQIRPTARALGLTPSTVRYHLDRAGVDRSKPLASGRLEEQSLERRGLPRKGAVKRYILTSAQSCTLLNDRVWENLRALAWHYEAEILVASYTYNQNHHGELAVKPGTRKKTERKLWFDPRVEEMIPKSDLNILLAPGLVWCGRMNTLPTAARPLQGFETYTGRRSGIFPHAKMAMVSVASGKNEATKFNYTTGTVTQLNYIQKREGLKAEQHHTYGGLVVEVDSNGSWWVRQLQAAQDGSIQDLDVIATGGVAGCGHQVEAITWGDVHTELLDPEVRRLAWGAGGMLDALRPRHQFLHDVLNFGRRNHHDRGDAHRRFDLMVQGRESVEDEVAGVGEFLLQASRDWCWSVVVDSNHDQAMRRWLRETDWRTDLPNAEFYLEANLELLRAIRRRQRPHLLKWAVDRFLHCRGAYPKGELQFLHEDETFIVCPDERGGIECGMHGHLGLNGARASPSSFARMGRRANTAHTHSAGIHDGVYTAGTSSTLDLEYNKGPSSWSHSHIVTYPSGSRAIITMWNGKWRA